jgi:deoxyribonuclease-4
MVRVGAHIKTAGGPLTCFQRALDMGAEAMQIFLTPPQQWRSSRVEPEIASEFRAKLKDSPISPVFVHGVYLINLAASDATMLLRSTSNLKSAMRTCGEMDIRGVIFHLGSHKGVGLDTVFEQICTAITEILKETPEQVQLVLENSAGAGANIGAKWADLGRIIRTVGSDRVRVCMDTQHAFAEGYDLASAEGLDLAMQEFEREVGWDRLVAVHANDSKVECGKERDRHENIGDGFIGREGFARIMAHPAFADLPFILEVPGMDGSGPDKANLDILKEIRTGLTR